MDGTLQFTFEIPQGETGLTGDIGPNGDVTAAQLTDAIQSTSANSNSVNTLNSYFNDPDAESLREKVNELINALHRNP